MNERQTFDWPRIKHLLKLGIFASLVVLAGDMLLGWGVADPSVTELPAMLSRYLAVSDGRIIASALLGLMKQYKSTSRAGETNRRWKR